MKALWKNNIMHFKLIFSKFAKLYLKYFLIFLSILFSTFLGIFIYCTSFYVHEAGHMVFGFLDNLIKGRIAKFVITNWVDCPIFPFLKLPQQTRIVEGKTSLNFTFGGTIFTILIMFFISYCLYTKFKNQNKKYIFLFPLLFFIHEILGNFLCGTDNLYSRAYPVCNGNPIITYTIKSIPYLLAIPIFILIYPYINRIIQSFNTKF